MSNEAVLFQNPAYNGLQVEALVKKVASAVELDIVGALARLSPGSGMVAIAKSADFGMDTPDVHRAVTSFANGLAPDMRARLLNSVARPSVYREILKDARISSPVSIHLPQPVLAQLDAKAEYSFLSSVRSIESLVHAGATMPQDLDISNSWVRSFIPARLLGAGLRATVSGASGSGTGGASASLNGGLHLRLHDVKCIDPTNWEWGKDEIAIGGVATDDKGNTSLTDEFFVGDGFKKGTVKSFSPLRILKSFSFNDGQYPKVFSETLAIAEKDSGGFAKFLRELYEAIESHVKNILNLLGAAAGAAIGAQVGASIGAIGGPLGAAIGIVAGMIVGAVVGWLIGVFKDEVFKPEIVGVTLPEHGALFDGKTTSPIMRLDYRDHGGHYRVRYSWEVRW